ncbi:DUF2087 domain-containing protein [Staphylococcus ursi]|nr:DUF2087 domain-containing protein [Staphylococcus sp. MI 10-1553]
MNKVVERFMKDDKIQTIPRKEKDKIALLQYLCRDFEVGHAYSEKEVNVILKKYYDDFAILRRYLVDYQFLQRDLEGKLYELAQRNHGGETSTAE